ncbi:S8 family serine peptidase [Fictibacillus nanhaiensis]|uniref:S8 family serine peptidase n=1 Tax=Fictibacillus nanhaiensis TaxID=742169 RepID=UPI002E1D4E03|nr:S8 family serine peptidase [Fictibacillus nanhaiensis]
MGNWHKKLASLTLTASLVGTGLTTVSAKSDEVKVSSIPVSSLFEPGNTVKENLFGPTKQKQKQMSDSVLIVKYVKPLTASDHKKAGASLQRRITSLGYDVVKIDKGKKLDAVMQNYSKLNSVTYVSPSALFTRQGTPDPKTAEQYHLSLLNVGKAQTMSGKNKVRVAVIDTGIDKNHPELKNKLLPSYNAVNPMNQGSPDSHGTHVAGIIAGEKGNGIGGYGINPNVEILPIDVFDRGMGASDYVIAEAILYAVEKKAKVINMSLGGYSNSPLIAEAVKKALAANVTVVAAAGNEAIDMPSYPAALEGVISVGSTNKLNELSYYSNYGPSVDVVAPGEDVYAPLYHYEKKSSFMKMSGTSMSSPVVAGVASLLLSKNPNLTPKQIEYILEHTTKDLGAKGYDTKFANGLVDPVKALSFNTSKIPPSVNVKRDKASLLKAAKKIDLTKKLVEKGAIKLPYEEKFVQVPVKAGQYIQTTLVGSSDYDYKMTYYLIGKDAKPKELPINAVAEGKAEGHLYKVSEDGTLVIGVSDANGNYNAAGKSSYQLTLEKFDGLLKDTNTKEKPVQIKAFPYNNEKETDRTFTAEENGDSDFYSFKLAGEEPQLVNVDLRGVTGIDSAIGVYMVEEFPEEEMEGMPEEEMPPMEHLMEVINFKPTSESEKYTFEAMPGMEYIIEVNNHTPSYSFMMGEVGNGMKEWPSSHLPYSLKVDAKAMSEDEDGLPLYGHYEEEYMEGDISIESFLKKRAQYKRSFHESENEDWMAEQEEMMNQLRESALEYDVETGAMGHLQFSGDEDYFKLQLDESGIVQFDFSYSDSVPVVEILKIHEFQDGYMDLIPVASNIEYGFSDVKTKYQLSAGLRKGEEYFIRVMDLNYQPSFDRYVITSKMKFKNTEDKHEPNNDFENKPVKDMAGEKIRANFGSNGDLDAYYVKAKSNSIYGAHFQPLATSKELKAKYPKELLQPVDGILVILEDTNGNRKLDEEEFGSARVTDRGFANDPEQGSFKAKSGKGYFIIIDQWSWEYPPANLNEYELTVKPVNTKDEDAGSVVKNNVPSKPIALKWKSTNTWESTGYLNAGVSNGDADWYKFNVKSAKTGNLTFANAQIDGVISLYDSKGKLVASSDTYGLGDAEFLNFSVKKGTYHVKVTDIFGNASLTPYTLKLKLN